MRASHQVRPETLLAVVGAFSAGMVILPPAVLAQEERPFNPPFLASAHRQSCPGISRPGFLPSGGLYSAHSRLASSNVIVAVRRGMPFSGCSAAVQVMADEGCVIAVHRDRGVIQRHQQIFLDVADIGGVLPHPVKDVLDMRGVQLQEP